MAYDLMTSDVDWLREIAAAADAKQALGGVPISVAAKLTGFGLVSWVGSYGLTLSSEGREALSQQSRLRVQERRRVQGPRTGVERRATQRGLPVVLLARPERELPERAYQGL